MSREKQIEEMASIITSAYPYNTCKGTPCLTCEFQDIEKNCYCAKALYNAGYRKQSEGEWREDVIAFCNVCSSCRAMVDRSAIKCNSGKLHYCPNCGAKMKGGAE